MTFQIGNTPWNKGVPRPEETRRKVTFIAYDFAAKAGPQLKPKDLLPLPPWEGPPIPRFLKEKPEVLEALRR